MEMKKLMKGEVSGSRLRGRPRHGWTDCVMSAVNDRCR